MFERKPALTLVLALLAFAVVYKPEQLPILFLKVPSWNCTSLNPKPWTLNQYTPKPDFVRRGASDARRALRYTWNASTCRCCKSNRWWYKSCITLRTLTCGNYGIFLIMGDAGFISSTESCKLYVAYEISKYLQASSVVISGAVSSLIWVLTIVVLLTTPLLATHEPPREGGFCGSC